MARARPLNTVACLTSVPTPILPSTVALAPSVSTMLATAGLAHLTPTFVINRYKTGLGMCRFRTLFKAYMTAYLEALTSRCKPRAIVLGMIYFPAEGADGSWANTMLRLAGYNWRPKHLQAVLRTVYEQTVAQLQLPGTTVIPLPFFEVLDPQNRDHYVQRVEPSAEGGRLMAEAIVDAIGRAPAQVLGTCLFGSD